MSSTKTCPQCQSKIPDIANICRYCGSKVSHISSPGCLDWIFEKVAEFLALLIVIAIVVFIYKKC